MLNEDERVIKILVVEDTVKFTDAILELFKDWNDKKVQSSNVKIVPYIAQDLSSAKKYAESDSKYDLVLLDNCIPNNYADEIAEPVGYKLLPILKQSGAYVVGTSLDDSVGDFDKLWNKEATNSREELLKIITFVAENKFSRR